MIMANETTYAPIRRIEDLIFLVRGQRVMLDSDLAKIYGVTTGQLNQAVKRNAGRFKDGFAFQNRERGFRDCGNANPGSRMGFVCGESEGSRSFMREEIDVVYQRRVGRIHAEETLFAVEQHHPGSESGDGRGQAGSDTTESGGRS